MKKYGLFLFAMFLSQIFVACEGDTVLVPAEGTATEGEGEASEGEGEGESVEDQTPIPSEGEGEGEGEGTDESQQGLDECGELGCQPPLNPDGQECPAGGCEAPLNPDDTGEGEGEGQALTPSEGEGEGQNQNPSEGEGEGQAPAEGEGEFTPDGINCRTATDCVLVGETTHCDGNVVVAMGNPVCNADRKCEYGVVRTDCGAEARCSTEGGTAHCAALPSCDDSDPCTRDTRNGDGSCGHTAELVATPCGEGRYCMPGIGSGVTTCEQVTCQDDGDECTREVLDPDLIGTEADNYCRIEPVNTQACRWQQEVTCSFSCPAGLTGVYVWHSGWNGFVSCGSNLVMTWGELCGWEQPSFSFNGRGAGDFWGRGNEVSVTCDAPFENRPNPAQGDLGKRDVIFRQDGQLGACWD